MVLHYDTEPNLFRVQVALEVTKFRERIAKYVAFFRRGAKLCIRMYEYVLAGTFVSTFALRFELGCTVLTHDFAGAFVRAKIITISDHFALPEELTDPLHTPADTSTSSSQMGPRPNSRSTACPNYT